MSSFQPILPDIIPVGILGEHAEDMLLAQLLQSEDTFCGANEVSVAIPPCPPQPPTMSIEEPMPEESSSSFSPTRSAHARYNASCGHEHRVFNSDDTGVEHRGFVDSLEMSG